MVWMKMEATGIESTKRHGKILPTREESAVAWEFYAGGL